MTGAPRFYHFHHAPRSTDISMGALRRVQRRLAARMDAFIEWETFSLDRIVAAVAATVGGKISLHATHWDKSAYTGLTIATVGPDGKQFLLLYEEAASGEHQLLIILHELMHILLGHCPIVPPQELRQQLIDLGLLPREARPLIYTRLSGTDLRRMREYKANKDNELEAEAGATWAMTRARQAGALPPLLGRAFTPEDVAIETFLSELGVG